MLYNYHHYYFHELNLKDSQFRYLLNIGFLYFARNWSIVKFTYGTSLGSDSWNVPTSFTDGAQLGLGAEIGISTQKLGPRGPMALEEICTYKWLIEGEGQTRP